MQLALKSKLRALLPYSFARVPDIVLANSPGTQPRRLNIGAGSFRKPGWILLDHPSAWYAKSQAGAEIVEHDLMTAAPLPFPDDSIDVAYCSHTIEHLTASAASHLLAEVRRVLAPGGTFRLTAPDVALGRAAVLRGDTSYFHWERRAGRSQASLNESGLAQSLADAPPIQRFLHHSVSQASRYHLHPLDGGGVSDEVALKELASDHWTEWLTDLASRVSLDVQRRFPGNHINWWTPRKATADLQTFGFTEVARSAFRQSQVPELRDPRHFDFTMPEVSFYVEAKAGGTR